MSQPNILIAESGSTKTQWQLCSGDRVIKSFFSPGVNPNVMSEDRIEGVFTSTFAANLGDEKVDQVIFYGAGLAGASQRAIIDRLLRQVLTIEAVEVEHDLLAAVRSTLRPEGIVCILGTGSNSCRYQDSRILKNLGGHGYIFGDEGSGMDLGRHLIKGILQEDFPPEVKQYVEEHEGNEIYEVKISIHQSSKPNVRMAGLAKYFPDLWHHDEVANLIRSRFVAFLDTTVVRYPGYRDLYCDFVGSIAHHFKDFLTQACENREVKLGKVIKEPAGNLVAYHLNQTVQD